MHNDREEHHGDLRLRVDPLQFSGTLQAKVYIDWLHEIEKIFDYKEVSDRVKVKMITIKLKVTTSAW